MKRLSLHNVIGLAMLAAVAVVWFVFKDASWLHGLGGSLGLFGFAGITNAQARIVDPILSQQSRGYSNPNIERAGKVLFPMAPIQKRGAKVVRFGKESYRIYNTLRAPGGAVKRVRVGYTDDQVNIVDRSLAGEVPFEHLAESSQVPGINLARRAINTPMEAIDREMEYRCAVAAQTAGNYATNNKVTLSGTDQWDDYTHSDPGAQMDDYQAVIRSRTGMEGNVLVLGPNVFKKARRHPKIVGHFYTGAQAGAQMVSRQQMAEYFGVSQIAVGKDLYLPESASDTDDFVDMWGNVAILAYVPTVDGDGDIEVPSYGYTYYLAGMPAVYNPRQDMDHRVWVYDVDHAYAPVLTGMDAGFLISDVLGG